MEFGKLNFFLILSSHNNNKVAHTMKSFQQWIKGSGLDINFGYLYPESYQPVHFVKEPLANCLLDLANKIQSRQYCQQVENLQDVQFLVETEKDPNNQLLIRDGFLLHGMLNKILSGYLLEKWQAGVSQQTIVVPKNIGLPLYEVSNLLKIKYGLTTDFYLNWRLQNQNCPEQLLPEYIDVTEITLLQNFHPLKVDEDLFFGGSVVGSHYLFQSIKNLYKINENIEKTPLQSYDENIVLLKKVGNYIEKMVQTNYYLLNNIKQELFMHEVFRKAFSGFQNLKFEGVQERLSSKGGAGGHDPLFQMFERMMGINYQGGEKKAQEVFKSGFPYTIVNLLKQCQETSNIREYTQTTKQLTEAYNQILQSYSAFYIVHRSLIKKYIIKQNKDVKQGTAGIKFEDIINRDKSIYEQKQ